MWQLAAAGLVGYMLRRTCFSEPVQMQHDQEDYRYKTENFRHAEGIERQRHTAAYQEELDSTRDILSSGFVK